MTPALPSAIPGGSVPCWPWWWPQTPRMEIGVTFCRLQRIGEGKENAMTGTKTDIKTERQLTPEQHRVLRERGTERPGSSPLNHEKRPGEFECAGCGAELFDAHTKFE